MDTGLQGRTAIVPGSSSGLGLAVARSLAAEGANVVLVGRRGELVQKEAATLPSAVGVEADLADPDVPARLVAEAEQRFGPVDVLVLNGGGPPPGLAADFTPEQFATAVDLLVHAPPAARGRGAAGHARARVRPDRRGGVERRAAADRSGSWHPTGRAPHWPVT